MVIGFMSDRSGFLTLFLPRQLVFCDRCIREMDQMRGSFISGIRFCLLLSLLLLNLAGRVQADTAADTPILDVTQSLQGMRLSGYVEYQLVPSEIDYTLAQFRARGHTGYQRATVPIPNFGLSEQTLWVRWKVRNNSEQAVDWLLDSQLGLVSDITLFKPMADGSYRAVRTGVDFPLASRDVRDDTFLFSLTTPAHTEQTYYLRIRNEFVLRIPMKVWNQDDFQAAKLSHNQFFSFFFGVLMAQALYNLLLFFTLRDLSYLWYVSFLGTILLGQSLVWGFAFQWLPDGMLPWTTTLVYFNFCAIGLFELLFVRQFLDLERRERWVSSLITVGIGWYLLMMAGAFFMPTLTIASVSHLSVLLTNFVVILLCLLLVRKYRSARFLLVGWLGLVIGGSVEVLRNMGHLPVNEFTMKAFPIGVMVDALALSFGLADRIRALREAKDQAQQRLNDGLMKARDELELRVEQRTRQLIDARQAAEDAIAAKNCYLQLVSHDLRSPLTSLKMIQGLVESQPDRHQELLSHTGPLLDKIVEKIDTLSHIRQIDSARGADITLREIELYDLAVRHLAGHQAAARAKSVQLKNLIEPGFHVQAEPWLLGEVLDNLVANAIKFSHPGQTVTLSGPGEDYTLMVADEGDGIDPERQQRLFRSRVKSQPGTGGETGQGYGLMLCRDVVDAHDGRLWCTSTPGEGSQFMLSLPQSTGDTRHQLPEAVRGGMIAEARVGMSQPNRMSESAITEEVK